MLALLIATIALVYGVPATVSHSAFTPSAVHAPTYEYDSPAAATTPPTNTRTDAQQATPGTRTALRSSPSRIGRFLAAKGPGRAADDVVDDVSRAARAPSTPFGRLKQDFLDNPDDWKVWSSHAEAARNRAARGGASIQTIYVNRRTGDRLVWHTVVSRSGRVIDDHPRPYYKARDGE